MDTHTPGASAPVQAAKSAVFQFHSTEVRTVDRDGQVWFAGDVAKALNYADAVQMTRVLDEDEKGLHTMQTLGGNQQVVVLSESGLYHALLKSRKPEARPFRRWVTAEVLPAIRRNGTSSVAAAQIPDALQKTRYLLTVYADGRSQITPLPQDAAVLSAKNKISMSTLMREFIPSEILPDLMHIGLDRLARMAEQGRNVPVCATPVDKEVEP
ncbi:Bro-N domain-containing protein [Acidithiobacillus ferrooxidans]|uniref:BRO family protein n=1 Tax=Acidithiobacillus ferrooxidans (strain ATCC 23270 / DSM 14882 / CIP 104768 / NCIMB 8455) TaxID=243159 RepID=B7J7H5_ACIF2|nr:MULTISPECIES: Bro-N domain-containing protein [Acidithiobacillus]ACK79363.1 BRO family protein [Acidithiobacillus ferrooxidans ATCC 23270]MBN6745467.1 Bro-N domain-containing protein [Acidithiobacillus sp. MC2.2]MBN6748718.1 Bro-N domain-containing protein [Acidithiobacillus sp. PG05]